ncbi:hypothetical protein [Limosilactobacillus sp.]|uniref:hypothetical protein n=1 Tax=Limosilactobacillus sp. TaxID=2773925 RepID=UPI003F071418
MNYQIILLCVAIVCLLLFIIQWFRQARHILHGGTRPLTWNHPALNWCLLVVAVLAFSGVGVAHTKTAVAPRQVTKVSSSKAQRASSSSSSQPAQANPNRQGTQQQGNLPAPEHQNLKLDQNGHAVLNNFAVPAKNQLQIIDAGSGNVLQTFPGQSAAGTVSYTFTKEGNYYLILTDGEQTKTVAVSVSR